MTIKIIHLSDLHFRENWAENQGVVLSAVITDISEQIKNDDPKNVFIVFSGDIILKGDKESLYDSFIKLFSKAFDKIGITKKQIICVPGNHDLSRTEINNNLVNHQSILKNTMDEAKFNSYVNSEKSVFLKKFDNYKKFELRFAGMGVAKDKYMAGRGWEIDTNIGIYCLNSATFFKWCK